MRITPKSAAEVDSDGLFQPGVYDFEIIKAEDKISAAGNEMIALTLKVFDDDGRSKLVNDWLMEKVAYKLRHACEATGLLSQYESGHLSDSDFLRRTGRVKLNITKDQSGQYPDKNGVADYVVDKDARQKSAPTDAARASQRIPARPATPARAHATTAQHIDDEIPF